MTLVEVAAAEAMEAAGDLPPGIEVVAGLDDPMAACCPVASPSAMPKAFLTRCAGKDMRQEGKAVTGDFPLTVSAGRRCYPLHPILDIWGQESEGSCPPARQGEVRGHIVFTNGPSRRLLVTSANECVCERKRKDSAELRRACCGLIDVRLAHFYQLRRNFGDARGRRTWVSGSKPSFMQGRWLGQGDSY